MTEPVMKVRGVRGAITVDRDDKDEILAATKELLGGLVDANGIDVDDVASVFFSMTPDLHAVFPAVAARQINWQMVPLFCTQELEIEGALPLCVRVLIHWNTLKTPQDIKHLYLRGAKKLRPDLQES
jgi:chorismate mutase